jgi:hypothetical protein
MSATAVRERSRTVSKARWQARDRDCSGWFMALLLILPAAKDDATMPSVIAAVPPQL